MSFWIYILKCRDASYYTGHTDNIEMRIEQHKQRHFPDCYTASRLPVELVFTQPHTTREEALAAERQIKGWSRKKKEAMMRGDWQEVSRLAQNTHRKASLRQAQGERDPAHAELVEATPINNSARDELAQNPVRNPFDFAQDERNPNPVHAELGACRTVEPLSPKFKDDKK